MKDDFETRMRHLITEAEGDIDFDRDLPAETPLAAWLETVTAPGIAAMRALWWPNWRR